MRLEGSCHCQAVRFTIFTRTPYPYMRCYCSICRKTGGGGGWASNIMGEAATLAVEGGEDVSVYRARLEADGVRSRQRLGEARRHFCRHCGSALWVSDPRWPELAHPFASAIDTTLPIPPERVEIMLDYAPSWTQASASERDRRFAEYPDESIEDWHRRLGLLQED